MDPLVVLASICIVLSLMGFAFQAGINYQRRQARKWYSRG